jgi:hypothetical protein
VLLYIVVININDIGFDIIVQVFEYITTIKIIYGLHIQLGVSIIEHLVVMYQVQERCEVVIHVVYHDDDEL